MNAMTLVNDAFDKIIENAKAALKISIPVLLFDLLVSGALGFDFWQAIYAAEGFKAQTLLDANWWRILLIPVLVFVVSLYWITVAWHRFVILEEQPGKIVPAFHTGQIWAYVWRVAVLGFLIGLVVIFPLGLVAGILGYGQINIGNYSQALMFGPVAVAVNFLGTAFFVYAFLRYSPLLVAAAIGQPIRGATAREATLWARRDIFLLAVGYAAVTLISTIMGTGISTGVWPIDLAISLVFQWVAFMFSISLITTLYQKSVEQHAGTARVSE